MIKPRIFCILFFLIFILFSCGFKPIYKTTENNFNTSTYSIEFQNEPDYLIKNKILEFYNSSSEDNFYTINLDTSMNSTPLITNTNGTVSKYRIEVIIDFNVNESNSKNIVYSDTTRGFAEYLVQTSEIETNEKLKQAIQIAAHEAIRMMSAKIQSNVLNS